MTIVGQIKRLEGNNQSMRIPNEQVLFSHESVVSELADSNALLGLFRHNPEGSPMPSERIMQECMDMLSAIIFPGYFGETHIDVGTLKYHIGVQLERVICLLSKQIEYSLCFVDDCKLPKSLEERSLRERMARLMADRFVTTLSSIRQMLATDVEAAYHGDPASTSRGEVISCYPSLRALTYYRVAHSLYDIGVPLLPRIISELAHRLTGIDIHPAAQIGSHCFIDHGTGVVIGATCIIGNHVKIYQGVTLGARSFPRNEDGSLVKGVPRHPIIEDHVIIYANATILGRVTIGAHSRIGGNKWVINDVLPGTNV